jgi:phage tail sheath gpL-like
MSTRAQVRFATREDGVSFSEHPEKIHAQFYVHQDGYPEGLGMDIAEMISKNNNPSLNWEIEHVQDMHTDLDYIYYVWSDYDKDTWISIFQRDVFQDICHECGSELGEYTVESIRAEYVYLCR